MARNTPAKTKEAPPPAVIAGMEEDSIQHAQTFSQDMLITPRLKIIQDLSPELKENKAEFDPEAKVGMVKHDVLGVLFRQFTFVPAKFFLRYIAWRPRPGGGLVDPNLTEADLGKFERERLGLWTGMMSPGKDSKGREEPPVRVEVVQTPEWVGIAEGVSIHGEVWGPTPVVISFPSSKVKSARKINTTIDLTELPRASGEGTYRPAAFYHTFEMATGLEMDGDNEWFGYVVTPLGVGKNPDLHRRAKDLKIAFDDDRAVVDDSSLER